MSGPLEERDEQQFYASERLKDCQHMILRMAQSLVVQRARVEKARSAGLAAARDAYSDLQEVRGYLLEALSDVRPCLMEVEEYKLAAAAGQLHAGLAHFDLMSTAYKPVYDALCGFAGSLPVSGTTKAEQAQVSSAAGSRSRTASSAPSQNTYEYRVAASKVQKGMNTVNTLVRLEAADGKQVDAFAPGEHHALTVGTLLTGVRLSVRRQDTVVFYVLEDYRIATAPQAA